MKAAPIFVVVTLILSILLSGCTLLGNQITPVNPTLKDIYACNASIDCIPKPGCHPMECINQKLENLYQKPQACTTIYVAQAAYSKADCLCSHAQCVNRNLNANKTYTEEDSIMIAKSFLESTSTYRFDGYGMKFLNSTILRCEQCWNMRFSFTSRYAGYGDRQGQNLLPSITNHIIIIRVEKGMVKTAIIDNIWDSVEDTEIIWLNNTQISADKYCEADVDCACGRSLSTGGCFYGNRAFVDETSQCPDFCTGIAANLEIRCIDSECQQVKSQ